MRGHADVRTQAQNQMMDDRFFGLIVACFYRGPDLVRPSPSAAPSFSHPNLRPHPRPHSPAPAPYPVPLRPDVTRAWLFLVVRPAAQGPAHRLPVRAVRRWRVRGGPCHRRSRLARRD